MRILHIDDNPDITKLLSEFLSEKKFDYNFTNNPKDGLNEIKQNKYDLILLDIHMPELNGIDIIEALENEDILKDQKIILFSGADLNLNQIDELLRKPGIYNCLKKPIEFSKLLSTLAI